jgi:hypothetical protein
MLNIEKGGTKKRGCYLLNYKIKVIILGNRPEG